uniref:Uncharacterized protein n=1 Tax=Arundo donax TaxID=35708 RepID=A0A0A9H367_ARUDO
MICVEIILGQMYIMFPN